MIGTNNTEPKFLRRRTLIDQPEPPTPWKAILDGAVWIFATPLAFLIRFDGVIPERLIIPMLLLTGTLVAVKFVSASTVHLHRKSWSRVAFRDLDVLAIGAIGIGVVATLSLVWFGPAFGIPRSIGVIDAVLTFLGMGVVRAAVRGLRERVLTSEVDQEDRKRVLVIGAGEAGSMVVREMLRHPEMGLQPVGFLDDDERLAGQSIATVRVIGTLDLLEQVLESHEVDEVLIAMPSADGAAIRDIVKRAGDSSGASTRRSAVTCRTIPGMYEVLSGQVSINRIRDVEIEDLLKRPPVRLDTRSILGYIEGKRVMVTGAGGSIGSELVRQICRYHPLEIILFGHGENSIYTLERELDRDWPHVRYRSVIGAIQNGPRLDFVFRRYRPDVVFHTAAHKHVPLMELNPEEAVFNNIVGSKNLIDVSLLYGISHFVNISTDKAVNPTSIMGASKHIVEQLVQGASRRAGSNQVFVSVRFGNVLGSRGSVIPLFKDQIRAGGPVTVTHPEMVRFFMTIPEAAQLVLQASGQGENGEIYILDMGEPVNILDLAHDLIELSGFEPGVDIPIEITGMRPGEKLYEEFMSEEERDSSTSHEKIYVATSPQLDEKDLERTVASLQQAALDSDHERIRVELQAFVEGAQLLGNDAVKQQENRELHSTSNASRTPAVGSGSS